MNALVTGCHTRMSSTGSAVRRIAVSNATVIHLKRRLGLRGIYTSSGDDRHILERRVLILLARAGAYGGNRIDDIETVADAAEHGVAVLPLRMIEEGIVGEVHEELRGCTIDFIGTRHGERAAFVLQAVGSFIRNRCARLPRLKIRRQPAALNDETGNDAMEYRAVEMSVIDVLEKILNRYGRLFVEQLHREVAVGGVKTDHLCLNLLVVGVRPIGLQSCAHAR